MPVINVNPNAEVSNFSPIEPGTYTMRIRDIEVRTEKADGTAANDCKVTLEHVEPYASLTGTDGNQLKGPAQIVSCYPSLDPEKQGMLRSIVEATGQAWEQFCANPDTDTLKGLELQAQLKVETYEGNVNNKFGRAIKA